MEGNPWALYEMLFFLCVPFHPQQRTENALLLSERDLRQALSPFYCEIFSEIAKLEGGIKFLVEVRGDILVSGMV